MLRFLFRLILFPFKMLAYLVFFCLVAYFFMQMNIPDVEFLKTHTPSRSSYMNLDGEIKDDEIKYTPLKDMHSSIIHAVIAAEDDLFFTHNGFNWSEILKAIYRNIDTGEFTRGGSTITQQLARNLFLSPSKSIIRKIREMILTYKLESELSKERILELYLNFAEFGPSIYGVGDGAKYHFNKTPKQLSSRESALMAGFLTQPKILGLKPYPKRSYLNQQRILFRMGHYDLNLPSAKPKTQPVAIQKKPSTTQIKPKPSPAKPTSNPVVTTSNPANTMTVKPKSTTAPESQSVIQNQTEFDDFSEFLDE